MEAFADYLIKSSVWLTGFTLIYVLFLRNERFFSLNRIYLVSGILVSIIFPLFTWHYTVMLPFVSNVEISDPQFQGIVMPEESWLTTQNALFIFYVSGISYLIFRILRQTLPVFRIIRKSETHQYSSVKLIRSDVYPASFSFFSFVFVNPSISDIETNEIVNHELEHIRQQHWIDLLLFEILCLIQWFNPMSWLYGRLIRQNHEYLADERALQRTSNPAIYRAALLNQMFGGPVISLANSFNYSLNKKRFTMMKQTINSPLRKLRLLLVLPLVAGVFYAFATPEYKFVQANTKDQTNQPQSQTTNDTSATNVIEGKIVKGKVIDEQGNPLKNASIIISGTTMGTISDASGNFELKMTDESPIVYSYVGFTSQKVKPDFSKEMKITMKRVVISIDAVGNKPSDSEIFRVAGPVLTFVDGKEVSEEDQKNIDPKQVESISVIKKKEFTDKYGEKGKNGVVLITLKPDEKLSATQTFKVKSNAPFKFGNSDGSGNQPLIIKDGVVTPNQDVNNIPPETIESIEVLKGESASILYGEKGKDGVILIKTKKEASASQTGTTEVKVTGYAKDQKENSIDMSNSGFQIRSTGTSGTESSPLIVIDGIITENQNIDKIDPETIKEIRILKGGKSTKRYGKKAKNGVIEITSKKEKEVFVVVEEMPAFPGGIEALKAFVASTLKYPAFALENRIQGQVTVGFTVEEDGSVTDAKIKSGVDLSLAQEALRIVNSMPKWKPGTQRGMPVSVKYEMPINFTYPADYHPKNKEKLKEKK